MVVTPSGKTILIDGGGGLGEYDVGEKVVLPFLLSKRIRKIDYVILSHLDVDHVDRGKSSVEK